MNKKIIALVILILAIWALCFAMIAKHNKVSCDQCTIEFKNTEVSGMKLETPIIIKVNATDLFEGLQNDDCLITWTRTGGYSNAG